MKQQVNSQKGKTQEADAGATLVFVAVVLVGLLALAAFAIDFGRMWEERRQLQNGADAAAVAIGEDCARGLCGPGYDEYAVAEIYVDANARDGAAWAWNVELDLDAQTVTVHNATEDTSGDNNFDMLFAGIVGFDGFTVGAQATVAWGYSGGDVATLPLIISDCEWGKGYPEGAGGYVPPPPPGDPVASNLFPEPNPPGGVPWLDPPTWWSPVNGEAYPKPTTLTFHDAGVTSDCAAQAGQDINEDDRLPGGFGWLEVDNTETCEAAIYGVDTDPDDIGWAPSDTGNGGPPNACDSVIESLLIGSSPVGRTVKIPYFDDVWTGPANGIGPCGNSGKCYHISGFGAFHVVGYKLSSGSNMSDFIFDPPVDPPLKNNGQPWPMSQWDAKFDCVPSTPGSNEVCLIGYFVEYTDLDGGTIGPGGRGITVIKFIA
jgi:Flp pilus assembly protein TadG